MDLAMVSVGKNSVLKHSQNKEKLDARIRERQYPDALTGTLGLATPRLPEMSSLHLRMSGVWLVHKLYL